MSITDILEAIASLNAELYNHCGELECNEAVLHTTGELHCIHYLGAVIWASDEDEREPDEPLYVFLVRKARLRIDILNLFQPNFES